jgi:tetratricopeptide (TPR) repeat protein
MAHAVKTETQSPANELRNAIDLAERLAPQLSSENVEQFLCYLDRIDELFEQLQSDGIDLRPEMARWEGLAGRLRRDPGAVVKAARSLGGMEALRRRHSPLPEAWWWRLDAEVARRRRQMLKRIGVVLGVIAGIVLVIAIALNTFLAPDPNVVLVSNTVSAIEDLVAQGQIDEAMKEVEAVERQLPEPDLELLLWKVVLAEQQGDTQKANVTLAEAFRLAEPGTEAVIWANLATRRLLANDIDGARAAGEKAVEVAPDEAQGYFVLGAVAEAQGDVARAIDYFEKTFELAQDKDPQLAVIARVRMGQLMQRVDPFAGITPTVTP